MQNPSPKSTGSLSNKFIFLFGLISGIALTSLIGFFLVILISLGIKSGVIDLAKIWEDQAVANQVAVAGLDEVKAPEPEVASVDQKLDHILGDPSAEISLIIFSDLECPFCKKFHYTTKEILAAYPGEVNLVFRHFPLDNLHTKARSEAQATECAAEQGKFWEYIDRLFEITPSNDGLAEEALKQIATELNLDLNQFEDCQSSEKYQEKINAYLADGIKAGARGTPYSILISKQGDKIVISGAQPASAIKSQIDKLLGK